MAANFSPTLSVGKPGDDAYASEESQFDWNDGAGRAALVTLVALAAGLTVAYWRMLVDTSIFWTQPQYSHGWIVPLIALYVMWARRPDQSERSGLSAFIGPLSGLAAAAAAAGMYLDLEWLQGAALATLMVGACGACLVGQPFTKPNTQWRLDFEEPAEMTLLGLTSLASVLVALIWAGVVPPRFRLALMLVAILLYGATLLGVALFATANQARRTAAETWGALIAVVGTSLVWVQASQLDMMPMMRLCFIVSLLGVFTLVGGLRLLHWAGPALAFLVFMFPLPTVAERLLLRELQKVASIMSTTVLQVMGVPVFREGSVMTIEGLAEPLQLEVAAACSGLRMSTIFGAMTVAMVFLIRRPWWDKLIILLSAIPVALVVNVIRIVVTALLYKAFPENKGIHELVHDWAGLAMMPVAMGILWLELKILENLSVEEDGIDYQSTTGAAMPRL